MWMLPDEDYLREHLNYTEMFLVTLVWNVGIFGIFTFGFFIVCLGLKMYNIRKKQKEEMQRISLLTYDESRQS